MPVAKLPRVRRTLVLAASVIVIGLGAVYAATSSSAGPDPAPNGLTTAVYAAGDAVGPQIDQAMANIAKTGARVVRLSVYWASVAPVKYPTRFVASDPADPHYRFATVDRQVEAVVRHGLQPILSFYGPPSWAQVAHTELPDAVAAPALDDYQAFATALARRYSGHFHGLPRVRYWMAWNEPNAIYYWAPQYNKKGRAVSPGYYRNVLNTFAMVVHREHNDNLVVAGSLTPFVRDVPQTMAPLQFMRDLLCMSGGRDPHPICHDPVHFDVWAHHPYTSGSPNHHALNPDDVSVADLPKMKALLDAAVAAGNVISNGPVRFWVTEFSWDSNPPDPRGVPADLEARWVAEALYRMWDAGVSLVTWLQLRDSPYPAQDYQSGLYYRGRHGLASDPPKPALAAFRFPFVAYPSAKWISYWGRTPTSSGGVVKLETNALGRWQVIATAKADSNGIFRGSMRDTVRGALRADFGAAISPAFSLTPPPDENLKVTPFGIGPKG
jgi:hypothetical protein